ncbi:MAG: hypothetical protein INR69_12290 [Mucilaginibacter polytrichastri]|nr:hypothetical protein [Mucilaginibacter polytrichastri]
MKSSLRAQYLFQPLLITLGFFRRHILLILFLGLIAAIGRVVQLGGFGPIAQRTSVLLEIAIESARLLIILFVLGISRIAEGAKRIVRLLRGKSWRTTGRTVLISLRKKGLPVLCSLAGFALIAFVCNVLIDQLARETCLLLALKNSGALSASSSEWTLLLFFKNLSVIPFTLIFECVLLLWLAEKSFNRDTQSHPAKS